MSLLFGRSQKRGWAPEPVPGPFPGMDVFSPPSSDAAMRIDTVWACVRLLSESVAMMPLIPMQWRNGVEQQIKLPPLLNLPAPNMSLSAWIRTMMISLLLRGNAYGWADDLDHATTIVPINPDEMSWSVRDGQTVWRRNGVELSQADVQDHLFHMTWIRFAGNPVGLDPIRNAMNLLNTQQNIDAFADGYFRDAPHPSAILTSDQDVDETQARILKDRVKANVSGRDTLVLGHGAHYQTLSVSPEESQFLQTQNATAERICRIFGVPPEMVGAGSSGSNITYANISQRSTDFVTFNLQPWMNRFVDAISQVLPGPGQSWVHVKFDTSPLIRMDPQDMAVAHRWQLTTGSKTINEARAEMGYGSVPWGDEPYLPGLSPAAAGNAVKGGDLTDTPFLSSDATSESGSNE